MENVDFSANLLLQKMAEGPIRWNHWNADTLKRAADLDRPLCVCVISATSRWSYAMKENFDDTEIVTLLNNDFVPVLCDADAAPHLALAARAMAQIMLGHAGWPLFLFLTPGKEPIFASSYMPKQSASAQMPGLLDVLRRIKWLWLMKRPQINEAAVSYAVQMKEALSPYTAPLENDLPHRAGEQLESEADAEFGGWGSSPKFPQAPKLALTAWLCRHSLHQEKLMAHLRKTVVALCRGGLYDPLAGGFHDYCRDREWCRPYLGKHTGQNVALLSALLDCWQMLDRDEGVREIFERTAAFLTDRFDQDGLLCAGECLADTTAVDAFYLWNKSDADAALGEDSASVSMTEKGNYCDPLTMKETGLNLPLFFAQADDLERERLSSLMNEVRKTRPLPPLDMRISARDNCCAAAVFARAARTMGKADLLAFALHIMESVEVRMIADGELFNALYGDERGGRATLDDMSAFVWACLELFRAVNEQKWLDLAQFWAKKSDEMFGSQGAMSLTATADHELLPAWDAGDDFMPSGSGIMLNNLVTLLKLTGEKAWKDRAESLIAAYGGALNEYPAACAGLTLGALRLKCATESKSAVQTE